MSDNNNNNGNGNGFSPFNYIEQVVSMRMVSVLEELFKKFNLRTLGLLAILLGIDSLKKIIVDMIETSKFNFLSKYKRLNIRNVSNWFNFNKNKPKLILNVKNKNKLNIKLKSTTIFWNAFYKLYKTDTVPIKFFITDHYINQQSKIQYYLTQIWNDIKIQTPKFECQLLDPIQFNFDVINESKNIKNACVADRFHFSNKQNCTLFELLPFKDFVDDANNFIDSGGNELATEINEKNIINIYNYLSNEFAFKDEIRIKKELYLILNSVERILNKTWGISNNRSFLGVGMKFDENYSDHGIWHSQRFRDRVKVEKWVCDQIFTSHTDRDDRYFNILLSSDNLELDLLDEWEQFTIEIQQNSKNTDSNKSIKIYDIKIDLVEEKDLQKNKKNNDDSNSDSSESESDSDKKKKNKKKNKKSYDYNMYSGWGETKKTKVITTSLINEVYKDFSTLYLKKDDHLILKNTLSRFKDKKDTYKLLGIPYKFNTLLYGEPGTGKTSTITTIACELGIDIYYVDISNVNSNEDLKMIFNHINKEISTPGVIVIEDIDAMTNAVLKRTKDSVNPGPEKTKKNIVPPNPSFDNLFDNEYPEYTEYTEYTEYPGYGEGYGHNKKNKSSIAAAIAYRKKLALDTEKDETGVTLECILNLTQGSLTQDGSMLIVTTNCLDKLDDALVRDGRFDIKLHLKACDHYQMKTIYKKFFERDIPDNIIDDIPEYKITPATFVSRMLPYILTDHTDQDILYQFTNEKINTDLNT